IRIGQPALVICAIAPKHQPGLLGIADTVDIERLPDEPGRAEQEVLDLRRAFAVTPVADPDKTATIPFLGRRTEPAGVSRFVPHPDPAAPARFAIYRRQGLPERQNTVIAAQIKGADRFGIAHGAMVGVME